MSGEQYLQPRSITFHLSHENKVHCYVYFLIIHWFTVLVPVTCSRKVHFRGIQGLLRKQAFPRHFF